MTVAVSQLRKACVYLRAHGSGSPYVVTGGNKKTGFAVCQEASRLGLVSIVTDGADVIVTGGERIEEWMRAHYSPEFLGAPYARKAGKRK
jgi:hypothetical protein